MLKVDEGFTLVREKREKMEINHQAHADMTIALSTTLMVGEEKTLTDHEIADINWQLGEALKQIRLVSAKYKEAQIRWKNRDINAN